jgi:hypothetical protein
LEAFGGMPVSAELNLKITEAGQRVGLAGAVTGLPEQYQGPLVMVAGRPVATQPLREDAEVDQHVSFADSVVGLPEKGKGLVVVVSG